MVYKIKKAANNLRGQSELFSGSRLPKSFRFRFHSLVIHHSILWGFPDGFAGSRNSSLLLIPFHYILHRGIFVNSFWHPISSCLISSRSFWISGKKSARRILRLLPFVTLNPSPSSHDEGDYKQDKEYKEKDFSDSHCRSGEASKPENSGNDSDDQKYDCPMKHNSSFLYS